MGRLCADGTFRIDVLYFYRIDVLYRIDVSRIDVRMSLSYIGHRVIACMMTLS